MNVAFTVAKSHSLTVAAQIPFGRVGEYRSQSVLQVLETASFCFVVLNSGIMAHSRMGFIRACVHGGRVQIFRLFYFLNSLAKAISSFTSVFTPSISFAFLSMETLEDL